MKLILILATILLPHLLIYIYFLLSCVPYLVIAWVAGWWIYKCWQDTNYDYRY